jgi:hypothetical protein
MIRRYFKLKIFALWTTKKWGDTLLAGQAWRRECDCWVWGEMVISRGSRNVVRRPYTSVFLFAAEVTSGFGGRSLLHDMQIHTYAYTLSQCFTPIKIFPKMYCISRLRLKKSVKHVKTSNAIIDFCYHNPGVSRPVHVSECATCKCTKRIR